MPPTTERFPFSDLHDHLVTNVALAEPHPATICSERRTRPRLNKTLPATVWGVDAMGDPFRLECYVQNISGSGLLITVPRRIKQGSRLNLVVRLFCGPKEGATAALKGSVVRSAPQTGESSEVAIAIREHRFI
jgi:hypothetical protein